MPLLRGPSGTRTAAAVVPSRACESRCRIRIATRRSVARKRTSGLCSMTERWARIGPIAARQPVLDSLDRHPRGSTLPPPGQTRRGLPDTGAPRFLRAVVRQRRRPRQTARGLLAMAAVAERHRAGSATESCRCISGFLASWPRKRRGSTARGIAAATPRGNRDTERHRERSRDRQLVQRHRLQSVASQQDGRRRDDAEGGGALRRITQGSLNRGSFKDERHVAAGQLRLDARRRARANRRQATATEPGAKQLAALATRASRPSQGHIPTAGAASACVSPSK